MPQQYQDYWKLTVEYTDIHGDKFLGTLRIIVDFIEEFSSEDYSIELYDILQNRVNNVFPKSDMGSVRKSINQFVKLGFINFQFRSYHELTPQFLSARTNRRRIDLFSSIFYSNSKLNASITTNSNLRQIHFLLRTLEEIGRLTKVQIMGLMTVDISTIERGYLIQSELDAAVQHASEIGFDQNKYNQISYLLNFLNKLNDVVFMNDELYFKEDAKSIFGENFNNLPPTRRDPYLHRNYKIALKEESFELYDKVQCMLEKLDYPILVASHIKPFIMSNENEAYDPNNGLLLSRTIDSLFDLNYISFNNEGEIIFSDLLSDEVVEKWKDYKLDNTLLNEERLRYLSYHNTLLKGISRILS